MQIQSVESPNFIHGMYIFLYEGEISCPKNPFLRKTKARLPILRNRNRQRAPFQQGLPYRSPLPASRLCTCLGSLETTVR